MTDPLKPSPKLLVKLGSAIVHLDELISPGGHPFDVEASKTILGDPEVKAWLKDMDALGFLPKKRA